MDRAKLADNLLVATVAIYLAGNIAAMTTHAIRFPTGQAIACGILTIGFTTLALWAALKIIDTFDPYHR